VRACVCVRVCARARLCACDCTCVCVCCDALAFALVYAAVVCACAHVHARARACVCARRPGRSPQCALRRHRRHDAYAALHQPGSHPVGMLRRRFRHTSAFHAASGILRRRCRRASPPAPSGCGSCAACHGRAAVSAAAAWMACSSRRGLWRRGRGCRAACGGGACVCQQLADGVRTKVCVSLNRHKWETNLRGHA
jgi:hypothetical protein